MIASPGPSRRPKALRQVERQRGHVGPEGDLGGRGVEKVGQGLPRLRQGRVGLGAGRESPVRVRIVVNKIIGHRLDHGPGDLCPARPVEVGHAMTVMNALERGEGRADLVGRRDG